MFFFLTFSFLREKKCKPFILAPVYVVLKFLRLGLKTLWFLITKMLWIDNEGGFLIALSYAVMICISTLKRLANISNQSRPTCFNYLGHFTNRRIFSFVKCVKFDWKCIMKVQVLNCIYANINNSMTKEYRVLVIVLSAFIILKALIRLCIVIFEAIL